MRNGVLRPVLRLVLAAGIVAAGAAAPAQDGSRSPRLDDTLAAVVHLKTFINPDGLTVENLGREREGSAVVIDSEGLILTIGYLMVEAHTAEIATNDGRTVTANIVGYDNDTGFGLLRAVTPVKVKPMPFGKSSDLKVDDPVIIAAAGGRDSAAPARVVAKREFAGGWEYLLDEAIFTAPPHPAWSGAALVSRDGKLVGIGSLIVGDATGKDDDTPGNMFVPIDRLPPILGDLMTAGRVSGPAKPWLGVTTEQRHGQLVVSAVTPGGPAEKAGIAVGDVIAGVGGRSTRTMAEFYRKVWAQGAAGATVPLDVVQDDNLPRRLDVQSMDRLDHLKLKSTF